MTNPCDKNGFLDLKRESTYPIFISSFTCIPLAPGKAAGAQSLLIYIYFLYTFIPQLKETLEIDDPIA